MRPGWFFGEDQGRYLLACRPEAVGELMVRARAAGVPLRDVGGAGGGDIRLGGGSVGPRRDRGGARAGARDRCSTDPCRPMGRL